MGLALSALQVGIFVAYIVFSVVKAMLPRSFKVARVGHTTLAATVLGAAHLLGLPFFLDKLDKAHAYGQLSAIELGNACDPEHMHNCEGAQAVYRASMVLLVYFLLMGSLGGAIHYVYANLWPVKFLAVPAALIGLLFVSDPWIFGVYAEVARMLSLVYLLFQGFLVLDFAHELHEIIGAKADEHDSLAGSSGSIFSSWWRILYLGLSAGFLTATGFGLASLFTTHASCTIGAVLAGITLAVGLIAMVLSLLESVGIGLLPPSIIFAHSTFLCWYALSSNPDATCNPSAMDDLASSFGKNLGVYISVILLIVAVVWYTWQWDKVLGLFGLEEEDMKFALIRSGVNSDREAEEEVESESQTSRVLYCVIMLFACAYAAMAMTAWASTDGSPESSGTTGAALRSMWFKVVAQWVSLLLQLRVIWVTFRDNQESSAYRSF